MQPTAEVSVPHRRAQRVVRAVVRVQAALVVVAWVLTGFWWYDFVLLAWAPIALVALAWVRSAPGGDGSAHADDQVRADSRARTDDRVLDRARSAYSVVFTASLLWLLWAWTRLAFMLPALLG